MKNVQKSVLIWYSAQEMYDLVVNVEAYPEFLPWCSTAQVLESTPDGMLAKVGIGYMGLKQSFTTRNHHKVGESVTMDLVDGPFSSLKGQWSFLSLPPTEPHIQPPRACRVNFEITYAFSSKALKLIVDPVFGVITSTFIDAFIKRANAVYGKK